MNFLKTTFLLSAMTGLFLAIGALAGGNEGMLLMLGMAGIMNIGAWFFSDTMVIKSTGAQPVGEGELEWLLDDVRELARKAEMPTPRVYWIPHEMSPNAFATGRSPKKGVVAVTAGILQLMDRRELKGVLAHEIGHIKNRDTLVSSIAATLAGAMTYAAWMFRFGGRRRVHPIVGILILIGAPLAAMVIRMAISRTREYGADRAAAELSGDPEGLANALEALGAGVERAPMENERARSVHFVVNGFTGGMSKLFSTHPPIEERVRRLRELAGSAPQSR